MRTLTIDIINPKALRLLQDLVLLQLIQVRKEKKEVGVTNWAAKYKGAMTKQPITEIDKQLNDLSNEWD